ncbi:3-galactosyl-N-acetylglucosaminide 4-alpha-L-fucosyltransferase FUT3-like [Protopterus annectens]|uniref:3-galactosyl-N-acetylglucosaminide 4-alpha-L-fucosyltransferase FUT3-like n=1 Tax=Protopterus annectens TaxID=7888 RepID=UPI001CFB13CE|nr:3-galactosyl-N-acetylglucosaminide 4-alpha-L-fucosyltransferase FUT3-like [Protopterus annectens]XP_043936681.1 3-galactosyl-N-acetylglucosaminide 4-alpha-L-fucosyltransferase FUT3-like [Protopterus annectens]
MTMDKVTVFKFSGFVMFVFILAFCIFSYQRSYHGDGTFSRFITYPITTAADRNSEIKVSEVNQKLTVLLWTWPWGIPFNLELCASEFGIYNCHLTVDRNVYSSADAVVFHYADIQGNPSGLPKQRPGNQYWVWYNMEPPDHCGGLEKFDNTFNLTLSYRRDSDIFVPYGYLQFIAEEQNYTIPKKTKLIAWAISNWNPASSRVKYYEIIKNYISIDVYGRNHKTLSKEDFYSTVSQYKFYFAFENSVHTDYITEKLYDNAFNTGAVPVVMGPSRQNYEQYVPANSFIHVDDFKTPEELANYLKHLDQNEEKYRSYFVWKRHFKVRLDNFSGKCYCAVCREITGKRRGYRSVVSVHKWFWNDY